MNANKFQFLFVYEDNTESTQLSEEKKVKAIRISENCRVSTDFIKTGGCSAAAAQSFAKSHNLHLLTPQEVKIIRNRLSGVRMMLKKCHAHQINHNLLVWSADNGDDKIENMEACSLSSGKGVLMGCHEPNKYCAVLCKL